MTSTIQPEDLAPGEDNTDRCPSCLFPKGIKEDQEDRPNAACVDNWMQLAVVQAEEIQELKRALHTEAVRRRGDTDLFACRLCWGCDGHYNGDTRSDVTHDEACLLASTDEGDGDTQ